MSARMNGRMPATTVRWVTPGTVDWTTKRFIPIGGVMRPISATVTTRMPNQTRSHPIATATGERKGTVSRIMDMESMKQPRTR